ncbi:MAG TPA: hypothetical protein V6C81_25285 [Planktothrix sp.]|jgi:hypothetical protein
MFRVKLIGFAVAGAFMLQPALAAEIQHDKIDLLNQNFRTLYAIARQDAAVRAEPILIVRRESLTLLQSGKSTIEKYFPPESDTLKVVDHIGLALFTILVHDSAHLDKDRLDRLRSLRKSIEDAREQIEANPFSPATLERQKKMIDMNLAFVDSVIQDKGCSSKALHSFVRSIEPFTDDNIKESVELELGSLYKAMDQIRSLLTPEEWQSMHVVIFGSHMARAQQMHFQYFQRLLDQTEEGDRIVFCEGSSEDKDAVNLLGTHRLDAEIGEAYFGDAWRMHKDLLSAAASQYLDGHPVK